MQLPTFTQHKERIHFTYAITCSVKLKKICSVKCSEKLNGKKNPVVNNLYRSACSYISHSSPNRIPQIPPKLIIPRFNSVLSSLGNILHALNPNWVTLIRSLNRSHNAGNAVKYAVVSESMKSCFKYNGCYRIQVNVIWYWSSTLLAHDHKIFGDFGEWWCQSETTLQNKNFQIWKFVAWKRRNDTCRKIPSVEKGIDLIFDGDSLIAY